MIHTKILLFYVMSMSMFSHARDYLPHLRPLQERHSTQLEEGIIWPSNFGVAPLGPLEYWIKERFMPSVGKYGRERMLPHSILFLKSWVITIGI